MKRRTGIAIGTAILGLAGLASCRGSLETRFVFPGATSQGQPWAIFPEGPGREKVPLQLPDGTRIVAVFGRALTPGGSANPDAAQAPTVIFFYGNGAFAAGMIGEFEHFRRLGMNAIMPDYPGYGMSAGKPTEAGCYAAADAAYDCLQKRTDVDHDRIVAAGWSLGAAVAIDLASRRKVSALVTLSAFTNFRAVAHAVAPWAPVSLIIRSKFDNLSKIPRITCPIFIAHGTRDPLVPSPMASELAAAAPGKVAPYWVDGGGHNDVFDAGGDSLLGSHRSLHFYPEVTPDSKSLPEIFEDDEAGDGRRDSDGEIEQRKNVVERPQKTPASALTGAFKLSHEEIGIIEDDNKADLDPGPAERGEPLRFSQIRWRFL